MNQQSKTLSPLTDIQGNPIQGSIRVKEYIDIHHTRQGIIIESENPGNPVLLFVHGGPGLPAYPLIRKSSLRLEKYFTVCYWDQRGTGMSFVEKREQVDITIEKLLEDLVAVTDYLRKIFQQEKIYLFAHSWGTFLASMAAGQHPERYHAYIGSGQIGNQVESEKETLSFLKRVARKKRDKQALQHMESLEIDETYYQNEQYAFVLRKYLMKFGGAMFRRKYSLLKLCMAYATSDAYSFTEKVNIIRGMRISSPMLRHLAQINLIDRVPVVHTPVYIIQGMHDYQTTLKQAKNFYDHVQAPKKAFYTFELSAHTPFIEEPDRFEQIVEKDILGKKSPEAE